ncbi:MAG: hypothetical protein EBV06_08165 [Planctomycetia bacterium]|nr:hypothetical protein [Planctomycetia bacterium]
MALMVSDNLFIKKRGLNMRLLMFIAIIVSICISSPCHAQHLGPPMVPTYGPFQRPGLSPYLNMLRNGGGNQFSNGTAAANYFLGVVPETQRRSNAADFSQRIVDLEDRSKVDAPITTGTTPLPNTLRRYFNNTGGYFPPIQTPRR